MVNPEINAEARDYTLSADIKAFYLAPIYPRVSGYVRSWNFDIGSRVRQGDAMAEIDTPEVDQQVMQAQGEFARATAEARLAEVTAARWKALIPSQAVSQQTTDEKVGEAQARQAIAAAARANVERLRSIAAYGTILAPFDGVVTARRIEIGALVRQDERGAALFEVAAIDRVRAYFQVPQLIANRIHPGLKVTFTLPQHPEREFVGEVATTSAAISALSRSMNVEVILPNPDGLLMPGAYAKAKFSLPQERVLFLPKNTLLFDENGPQVATVEDGYVVLKKVVVFEENDTKLEILSGLDRNDKVITGPRAAIATGDRVSIQ